MVVKTGVRAPLGALYDNVFYCADRRSLHAKRATLVRALVYRLLNFGLRRYIGESASFINGVIFYVYCCLICVISGKEVVKV